MSAEKPLSTEELVELGYTSNVAAKARDEIVRLRARQPSEAVVDSRTL